MFSYISHAIFNVIDHFRKTLIISIGDTPDAYKVSILFNPENISQLMLQSDLCILSCGTMILEACALGVPSIGLAVAENQKSTAEFLARSGAIELYDFNNEKDLSIYDVILDFINNPKRLSLYSKKLKTMVSSNATEIIARRLYES